MGEREGGQEGVGKVVGWRMNRYKQRRERGRRGRSRKSIRTEDE